MGEVWCEGVSILKSAGVVLLMSIPEGGLSSVHLDIGEMGGMTFFLNPPSSSWSLVIIGATMLWRTLLCLGVLAYSIDATVLQPVYV